MEFAGGTHVLPVAGPQLPGKVNYIRGNDPRQWKLGVPTYAQVTYQDVYPGVDVVYYGNQQQLEFDLVVKPGTDPQAIRMKFDGARKVSLDAAGQLVLDTRSGAIHLPLSRVHQDTGGAKSAKQSIEGHYVLRSGNEVGFEIAAYDRTKPLVIDPTIQYGALFGGNGDIQSNAIALDASGNIYLTGYTYASDFPTTAGSAQPGSAQPASAQLGFETNTDGFATKIDPSGTTLLYSTYLGGSGGDVLNSIAVDSTGAAWVAGFTSSTDFPMVNPYQGTFSGNEDAVLAKLSSSGVLQFSTYLGGSGPDVGNGVAVDASNNAYVTGNTSNPFPTTPGVLLPSTSGNHGFVAKFNSAGSIVYSTLLGGDSSDAAYAVAADASGNAYVTGGTSSTDFTGDPGGGARTTNAGGGDAFIAKLNPTGTALLYFTFLGGSGSDSGATIALDASSPPNAYVGGSTTSSDLNPTAGVVGASFSGDSDGFVAELNGSGSAFSYITYLGGTRSDYIYSLAVEPSTGDVYVTGNTESADFPVSSAVEAFPSNSTSLFQTSTGTSWFAFDTNIPGVVNTISPDPVNSGTLVVLTDSGIYRTTNGGSTWTLQLSVTPGFVVSLSRSPANPSMIYAMNGGYSYLSTDGGVTWNRQGFVGTTNILADPLSSDTAYGFSPIINDFDLYKTTDGGMTWYRDPLSGSGFPFGATIYGLVAAPDATLYAVTTFGVYESADQGATWTVIGELPCSLDVSFRQGQILSVSASASGNVLYLSCSNTVYKNTNGAASWTAILGSIPSGAFYVSSSPSNANLVYAASSQSPSLYVSADGGATWTAASTGLGTASVTGVVFNPFISTGAFAFASLNSSAFVTKLNSTATAFVYSTYLGGSINSTGQGIASNGLGEAFVTGSAVGAGFPVASTLPAPPNSSDAFVVAITDSTATCSYSINPTTQIIQSSEQTVTYGVNAPSGCSWTAMSDQSWATIISGASGTGAGLVTIQTTANNTGSTQSASLTINTASAILTQAPSSCTYSLSSYSAALGASGGPLQVNVTTSPSCPWTVVNNDPSAIDITSASSGVGNGTVNFTVGPSAALNSRFLELGVMGAGFVITEGGVCIFSLNSTSFSLLSAGGTSSVNFMASAEGCSFTAASSNSSWLTITNYGYGSGKGTVYYSIAANTGAARSGTLTIGGQTFTVNQGALATPANRTFVSTNGSDLNNCTVSAYCRTLAAALALTNPEGEIVMVDSGGYGAATITQPVVITAIDTDASITATSGNALTINTTGNVTITGLNLYGAAAIGNDGILVQAVGFLRLYNVQIQDFANNGIEFTASGNLAVYDSKVNDSGQSGLLLQNAAAQAYVHNTDFDNNTFAGAASFSGNMTIAESSAHYNGVGFYAYYGSTVSLSNDSAIFNTIGLAAFGGTLNFADCLISDNTTAWSVAALSTMTDTSPGTSLITPGQLTSGTLTSATALQ